MTWDIGAVSLAAAVVTAVFAWLTSRSKMTSESYDSLVTHLHADNAELRSRVTDMQAHVEQCEADNAELRSEIGQMKATTAIHTRRIEILEEAIRNLLSDRVTDKVVREVLDDG